MWYSVPQLKYSNLGKKLSTKFSKIPLQSGWKKFVRKPAANFIGRNKSPEFYVTFRIVTRRIGVNKITQPEMR